MSFTAFQPLTVDDVISAVWRLPDKSSAVDPIPTNVLKQVIDLVAPFIAELFSQSLHTGHFPDIFHQVFITLIVKKPNLDATDASSYRPISNLSVLSKLLWVSIPRTFWVSVIMSSMEDWERFTTLGTKLGLAGPDLHN